MDRDIDMDTHPCARLLGARLLGEQLHPPGGGPTAPVKLKVYRPGAGVAAYRIRCLPLPLAVGNAHPWAGSIAGAGGGGARSVDSTARADQLRAKPLSIFSRGGEERERTIAPHVHGARLLSRDPTLRRRDRSDLQLGEGLVVVVRKPLPQGVTPPLRGACLPCPSPGEPRPRPSRSYGRVGLVLLVVRGPSSTKPSPGSGGGALEVVAVPKGSGVPPSRWWWWWWWWWWWCLGQGGRLTRSSQPTHWDH